MKKVLIFIFLAILIAGYFLLPEPIARLKYPLKYEDLVVDKSKQFEIPPSFLASLVYNESRFNPEAVSTQNAYGLAQIQLPTAKHVLKREINVSDLKEPELNLKIGAKYLRELLDRYEDDKIKVLIAYNLGPTKLDRGLKDGNQLADFEDSYLFARKVVEIEKIYLKIYGDKLALDQKAQVNRFNLWSSLLY
jgi:soluble lytic murein transglycosylase